MTTTKIGPNVPAEVHDLIHQATAMIAPPRPAVARLVASPGDATIVRITWTGTKVARWLTWSAADFTGVCDTKRRALDKVAAGLVQYSKTRSTGTYVAIFDGEAAGMDLAGGRWNTVCETHSTICSHGSLTLAREFASEPTEWCEACSLVQSGGCDCDPANPLNGADGHEFECPLYNPAAVA